MTNALQTIDLHVAYPRSEPILRGIDMAVPSGAVYGFLGQNGSGKSTLLKTVVGLLFPKAGEVHLLGQPLRDNRPAVFSRVGALIEQPSLYSHLSGRRNLLVSCAYRGLPADGIDALLDRVGLLAEAEKPTSQYSTGMKQRLGIALALLHDPELLILDEPTNGLDAKGIRDIRQLILELGSTAGISIIQSSHILSEIEQTCTHIGLLKDGRLAFQGSMEELRSRIPDRLVLLLETDDNARAARLLNIDYQPDTLTVEVPARSAIPPLIDRLRGEGIGIYRIDPQEVRLEDLYLALLASDSTTEPTSIEP